VSRNPPADEGTFIPAWIGELELAAPIVALTAPPRADGTHYRRARMLVRTCGTPLGVVELELVDGTATAETVQAALAEQLGPLPPATPGSPESSSADERLVSVVICTRDHPEPLARAIAAVLASSHTDLELIVVDNAPSDEATRTLVEALEDARVRYVLEPAAGLSRARNRGLAEARGEIVAFTDDDCEPDVGWIDGLLTGFARGEKVGLVTGLIPMAALENEHQQYFDDRVQWSNNFAPRLFDLADNRPDHPFFPYAAGIFGTGANFALTAETARAVGPFDVALGAGAPTRGGEDLDYFVRTLFCDGRQIAYEPRAIVWHHHRADADSLAQQMYGYGSGFTAYAFKTATTPRHFLRISRLTASFLWRRIVRREKTYGVDTGHGELRRLQRRGLLAGPWLYLRARLAR
jgi:glycosyltransferase involved in cell wall biosynthesis